MIFHWSHRWGCLFKGPQLSVHHLAERQQNRTWALIPERSGFDHLLQIPEPGRRPLIFPNLNFSHLEMALPHRDGHLKGLNCLVPMKGWMNKSFINTGLSGAFPGAHHLSHHTAP